MDMAHNEHEASRLHRIWRGWRKEIIRGLVLFVVVVGIGLAVTRMFGVLPLHVGRRGGFDFGDFSLDHRNWVESFRWAGQVAPDQWVWIRNLNGPVSVESAPGDSLVVTAEKSWRRSSPDAVEIVAVPHGGTVTVCALWEADHRSCGANGDYAVKGVRKNDVAVRFTVHLPRGVKLDVSTVNGRLEVRGASAPVTLETVNGEIEAVTSQGPVRATTVNGSIDVRMDELAATGDIALKTVNGSITAAFPAGLDADLDAQTVTGRVNTGFPLQVVGRISSRHVRATIGSGGRQVNLRTVNGSIEIQEAGGAAAPAIPPAAPSAPVQPR